jgi:hypothetical protein
MASVLDCEAKRDGLAPSTQLGGGITGHGFPAGRTKFPVPDHREFDATASETLGNLGPDSPRGVWNRRNSLYLPCLTGIHPQRRVRPRLPSPPFSLPTQQLPASIQSSTEKKPRFRGFCEDRISEADRRRRVRARMKPWPAFFSVAMLGDSLSLSIRPPPKVPKLGRYGIWMNDDGQRMTNRDSMHSGFRPRPDILGRDRR